MGEIIKGKPVADAISSELIAEVESLKSKNIIPKLTIVRVGENGSDIAYERGALKRCSKIGIKAEVKKLPEDICEKNFIEELKKINEDKSTNGIMIFRPLPGELHEDVIKHVIDAKKDVDCFNPLNMSKLLENDASGFAPCTAAAVIEILKYYNVEMQGKRVAVVGRSMVVGKPLSLLLLNNNATVTICHSKTKELEKVCSEADILIACVGKSKMINSNHVKPGAVVIDVGINVEDDGTMCGDVDTEDCVKKAAMITPVPGGVGSVTTSILAKQVISACKLQNANNESSEATAYVDGSFNNATCEFSCGGVIFWNNKKYDFSQKFSDEKLAEMRNVAGEIKGAERAIKFAMENKIGKLTIYHDYEGIAKWCTGEWKAKKDGTMAYRDFYENAKENINIAFVKVKGHSGDKYNDMADKLARQALEM